MSAAAGDEASFADAATARVQALFKTIGTPETLDTLGLDVDKLDWTCEQAMTIARLIDNNPCPLDAAAMKRLVSAAQSGNLQNAS